MLKPKALIFTSVEGHASIAEAIEKGLKERGWQVKVASYDDPSFGFYRVFYRYAPNLFFLFFKTMDQRNILKLVNKYTHRTHSEAVYQDSDDFQPDVIINTWSGFDSSISLWRIELAKEGEKAPIYANVLADPWTFSVGSVSRNADFNCFFDEGSIEHCNRIGLSPSHMVTGWFVRSQFRISAPKEEVRRQLKLDEQKLTLLFVAGSEGEVKSAKLIPALLKQTETPLQIILACGSNEMLKAKFDKVAESLPENSPHTLLCLPFTKKLHVYVQAADLMIGKAGPNTIFEAVAAETPFFATTHISGQEDGNLELIRAYNIGYVEESLSKAEVMLQEIIADPKLLRQFQPSLKKLAKYNDGSIDRFVKQIEDLTN